MNEMCGKIFGRLVVVNRVDDYIDLRGHRRVRYLCLCSCGNTTVVRKDKLISGNTTSCGCKKNPDKGGVANCAFHPIAVDCTELNCDKCGWNPFNTKLRAERIKKVMIKAGRDYDKPDETEPETADS